MNSKFTLAVIALVGVGVFALPSTMALFAGQHSFYNIDATGNQVPCTKCHGDVKSELQSNSNAGIAGAPNTPGPHANFKCEYCHRAEPGSASGDSAYGLIVYGNSSSGYRYLALTVYDFEAQNYPKAINGSDVLPSTRNGGTTTYGSNVQLAGVNITMGAVLSAINGTSLLTVYSERLNPTYDRNTGAPLDTNASTMNGGLDLTQVLGFAGSSARNMQANLNNSGSKSVNPGTTYHAASLVSCMECHRGSEPFGHYTRIADNGSNECGNCHYGGTTLAPGARMTTLWAGGFNLTNDPADTGSAEAHNAFVKQKDTNNILRYNYNTSNAACVGCHTHVAVDINFTKRYMLSFDATGLSTNVNGTGDWNIGNYKAVGDVKVNTFGNASGQTFAVGNHTYVWPADAYEQSNMPTLYINGTQVTGLYNTSSDSAGALTGTP